MTAAFGEAHHIPVLLLTPPDHEDGSQTARARRQGALLLRGRRESRRPRELADRRARQARRLARRHPRRRAGSPPRGAARGDRRARLRRFPRCVEGLGRGRAGALRPARVRARRHRCSGAAAAALCCGLRARHVGAPPRQPARHGGRLPVRSSATACYSRAGSRRTRLRRPGGRRSGTTLPCSRGRACRCYLPRARKIPAKSRPAAREQPRHWRRRRPTCGRPRPGVSGGAVPCPARWAFARSSARPGI